MNCIANNFKNGFAFGFVHHFVGGLLAPFAGNFGFYNYYSNPYSNYMGSCFSFMPQQSIKYSTEMFKFREFDTNSNYSQQSIWDLSSSQMKFSSDNISTTITPDFGFSTKFTDFYNDLDFKFTITSTKSSKNEKKGTVTTNAKELAKKWQSFKPKAKDITEEFCQKVIDISKEIGCAPDDLMAVMNLETAGTFSPSVQNEYSQATGLIQFMPQTAASLFTSAQKAKGMSEEEQMTYIKKLKSMSAVEQLDYVKKYLINGKNTRKITGSIDATTLYCLIFWPEAASKDDSFVIVKNNTDKEKDTYDVNIGLDKNKDGVITRGDLRARVAEFMA